MNQQSSDRLYGFHSAFYLGGESVSSSGISSDGSGSSSSNGKDYGGNTKYSFEKKLNRALISSKMDREQLCTVLAKVVTNYPSSIDEFLPLV
jgi:hypothetical protein